MKHLKTKSRLTLFAVLYAVSILYKCDSVNAAEKNVNVNIDKDYANCVFTIDIDVPGNYTGTIVAPNNAMYECAVVDDDTLTCQIEECVKGEWSVSVSDAEQEQIGKIKVTVSTAATKKTDIVDNISVGKDIAGLKIYFKDDDIIAEWTDDSCGNVSVSVTNVDTMEIIDNRIVEEKQYQCRLDPDVKKISISIVPASSASIEGAAITYTYDVNNNPKATVTYPENTYINKEYVPVKIDLQDSYGVLIENNEEKVLEKDIMQKGEYNFDVPLTIEGENNIVCYIVDDKGNMRSTNATIIRDTIAPVLTMKENYNNIKVYDSSYKIYGNVSDFSTLKINETPIDVLTDGTFEYECKLHIGDNDNTIIAEDNAGNQSEIKFNIFMEQKKETKAPKLLIVVLGIGFIYLFFKLKKRIVEKQANSNNEGEDVMPEQDEFMDQEVNIIHDDDRTEQDMDRSKNRNKHKEKDESLSEEEKNSENHNNRKTVKKATLGMIVLVVVLTTFLCKTVVLIGYVPTNSMTPAISQNHLFLADRLAYRKNDPQRGDIIFFYRKDDIKAKSYCKRIIGIPGDRIEFSDGYVYVNGKLLNERGYLSNDIKTHSNKSFIVPENSYFVLGDNRESSIDSRYWDNPYVDKSLIIAKAVLY